MQKVISGRQTGKTMKLIKLSAETGNPILTANSDMAMSIKKRAKDMGVVIPDPFSVSQILSGTYMNQFAESFKDVIVDDSELVLQSLLKAHHVDSVKAISISTDDPSDELITDDYYRDIKDIIDGRNKK